MIPDESRSPRLLPGRYVALDFETTGLSSARDRIIDVGAVECIDGEMGRTFSVLVNPGIAIPPAITRLTGIDDAAVAKARPFTEIAPELLEFLGTSPILAHNARFEREFLGIALKRELPNPFLDTLELAGLVRGGDPRRSLGHLTKQLGLRDQEVHRGLEDAVDCLAVTLEVLRSVVAGGRRAFVDRVLRLMDGTSWGWLPAFRALGEQVVAAEPVPASAARRATAGEPLESRSEPDVHQPISTSELEAAFAADGALAREFPAWEPRIQQREMADAIGEALSVGCSLMVEAPTGVGKSLAYLVPAALFARRNRVRVLIATHTKNLQDQLASQDLPRAFEAVGGRLSWRVLKGQENYICTRRALRWLDSPLALGDGESERVLRAYVASFLELTPDGDLEVFMPWHSLQGPHVARALEHIRSVAPACLTSSCIEGEGCFYQNAVAAARDADLIVTNHALALAWPARYPESRHLIVDEAHDLEDAATSRFSTCFDPSKLARVLDELLGQGRSGGLLSMAQRLASSGSRIDPAERLRLEQWLGRSRGSAQRAAAALAPIRAAAERLLVESGVRTAEEGRKTLRLVPGLREHPAHGELVRRAGEWAKATGALLQDLSGMVDTLGFGGVGDTLARELAGAAESLAAAREVLDASLADGENTGQVHWIEVEDTRGARYQRVHGAPVSVAELVVENLFSRFRTVVLTSATLTVGSEPGGAGAFVATRIGFDLLPPDRRLPFLDLDSPFDLKNQLVLAVPNDLADVNAGEKFLADVTRVLADVARRLGGRTLALFAANKRRDGVGDRLERELRDDHIAVLVQGTGGGRDRLVQALREGGRKVVLGSRSFWEGVDVPGANLSCVVIEKLPFDFPGEPLHEAREQAVREAGGDPFQDFTLPRALLKFQQGVGRLVRTRGDRGIVLLLQSNLYKRAYAKSVFDALPGVKRLTGSWAEIRDQLGDFTDTSTSHQQEPRT